MPKITAASDRLLDLLVPHLSAAAQYRGCMYNWQHCYCKGGLRYRKKACFPGASHPVCQKTDCTTCHVWGTCP